MSRHKECLGFGAAGRGAMTSKHDTRAGFQYPTVRLILLASMITSGADAQVSDIARTNGSGQIVVTGRKFLSDNTSSTTNLPISIEKVPQSLTVVSEKYLEAANLTSLAELIDYTAGTNSSGDQLDFASLITLRGFSAGGAIDELTVGSSTTFFEPDDRPVVDRGGRQLAQWRDPRTARQAPQYGGRERDPVRELDGPSALVEAAQPQKADDTCSRRSGGALRWA